jgi:hypothetical protein
MEDSIASATLNSVFGDLARNDSENQIPMILNTQFESMHASLEMNDLFMTLLFGSDDFKNNFLWLSQQAESLKSICAKTLTGNDVAWKWEDCEMDPTCIICMGWFEKSDHKGHRTKLQRGAAGCCDWGDSTAWKEEGFWSDHKGYPEYNDQQINELLPDNIGQRANILFKALGEFMHKQILAAEKNESERDKYYDKITNLLAWVMNCLKASPLFIHLFTKMFSLIHPNIGNTNHECSPSYYIDNEHKQSCVENWMKHWDQMEDDDHHPCTCTLISLIFKIKNKAIEELFCDSIIFKMFQSLRFKNLIGFTYVANYKYMIETVVDSDKYIHLGVQILTIPEIALAILQDMVLSKPPH